MSQLGNQMNKSGRSFIQKRTQSSSTPISLLSRRRNKQQKTIEDIYNDMKQKINQMQQVYKSQNTNRQRQLLQTYIKILDKIGIQVMTAKQKYLNLDKQNLKTDKRLQIVKELNKQRQQCNKLTKSIKQVKQQIKKYQDQNNYLEKQVQALSNIYQRKKSLSKSEHKKYRNNKSLSQSLDKKIESQIVNQIQNKVNNNIYQNLNQNGHPIFNSKRSFQITNNIDLKKLSNTYDVKTRAKSFIVNNQQPDASTQMEMSQLTTDKRPHTQQNYISNRRKKVNKYINLPLQQNTQLKFT